MGRYLNSSTSYVLYKGQTEQPYFVDKSQMLSELFLFLDSGNTHICITRPRRFGKIVMANIITTQQVVDLVDKISTVQGASVAINRLIDKDLLKKMRQGRHVFYCLK